MKQFAEKFYKSNAWKVCRDNYAASVGGLCERCLRRGMIVPGEIVHHKVELTERNITDPTVTLAWDNLELVCRDCHGQAHQKIRRRYIIDDEGRVMTTPPSAANR